MRTAKALQHDPEELRKQMLIKQSTARPKTKKGKIIRARREELALTLEEFAKRMGATTQQAKYLEVRHGSFINYNTAKKLARVLNLDVSAFAKFVGVNAKQTKSKLGQKVRRRRQELGMSSTQLAQELGVSPQLVSQIELGQCSLHNNERMRRLAEILKFDVGELQAIRLGRRLAQRRRTTPLGRFATKRRLKLHLNQTQVAERTGIAHSTIARIETGSHHPSHSILERLSKALECEIPPELALKP